MGERLESCDIPNLDKFTLTLFMAIADRGRVLISIRPRQALEARRIRVGKWRVGGLNARKAAAGLLGPQRAKEIAEDNKNSRQASALISMLRTRDLRGNCQMNVVDFETSRGSAFYKMQAQRLHKCIFASKEVG